MKAYLDTSVVNVLLFSDYFVTYDHHFDPLKDRFRIVTPAELLKELEASQP
ncbi:hypothetical protein L0337_12590 [candidate division KSB1 bacterium]|nr:hypothetical protein [candidate division KSB1 bacterium]